VYRFQLWTARTLQHPGFVAVQRQALRLQLTLARRLGNEQAEALTLNELALALAERGAEAEAVEHLEEALVVLREIGDQEHEAQVIANLGMVYRRQGQSEEAAHLFQEALEKLSPESPAYREVEKELLRAS
jgi:tetratricopeptide (TPR) repeat protein